MLLRITFSDDEENLKLIDNVEYIIIKMSNYTNLNMMIDLNGASFLDDEVSLDILVETLTNNFNSFTLLIDNYGFGFETLIECMQLNYSN